MKQAITIVLRYFLTSAGGTIAFMFKKRDVVEKIDHHLVPSHMAVKKGEHLSEDINNLANKVEEVIEEFRTLEEYAKARITNNEETTIALSEENLKKNRYKDMVPFNSNIVKLSKPSGTPSTTYINASWVRL